MTVLLQAEGHDFYALAMDLEVPYSFIQGQRIALKESQAAFGPQDYGTCRKLRIRRGFQSQVSRLRD